ncbi:MAG: class I SAM-dependent methyltransferase [Candidatus Woesearchaeota archaeon]
MTYYDEIAHSYNELHGEEQKKKVKIILDYFKKQKISLNKKKILDVGCGTGIATKEFSTIGIDPSIKLLQKCGFPVVQGKGERLPFADKSFDIIICLTAIHNFDDWKKGIAEIKRVTKKIAIISVLKKAKQMDLIAREIKKQFKKINEIEEEKDIILFCERQQHL